MSTALAAPSRPSPTVLRRNPAAQAFVLLWIAFTVAPVLFGLDKFAEVLISDWPKYLATEFNDIIPGSAQDAMYMVGAIEILAGLVVAIAPRFGSLLVAGWLGGIIVSLLLVGGYADIALRDFGLLLAALTLFRLASAYSGRAPNVDHVREGEREHRAQPATGSAGLRVPTPRLALRARHMHPANSVDLDG